MTITAVHAVNEGVLLAGSLWEPEAAVSRALLAMHPGSGPSDRDNDVLFPPIRDTLLEHGIAVCSFDKRGVGSSGGTWLEADILTQAADFATAIAAARSLLPPVPVGLFGHSQGGWVVLEACEQAKADFVITNSGPGVTPRAQEEYSTRNRLARMQLSPEHLSASVDLFDTLMDRLSRAEAFDVVDDWLRAATRSDALATLLASGAFVPRDERLWKFAGMLLNYDPKDALQRMSVPLLALFGSDDTVVPVAESADRFRENVPEGLLSVRILPGGDNRIQTSNRGYFAATYLDEIIDFITSRFVSAIPDEPRSPAPTG